MVGLGLVVVQLGEMSVQAEQELAENWQVVLVVVEYVVMILRCLSQLQREGGEQEVEDSVVGVVVMGICRGCSARRNRRWQFENVGSLCQLERCRYRDMQTMRLLAPSSARGSYVNLVFLEENYPGLGSRWAVR